MIVSSKATRRTADSSLLIRYIESVLLHLSSCGMFVPTCSFRELLFREL